ncbi:hypothetical protein PWR63_23705 [Paraburkholderia sp. A2WS-5]|uniref:hypothetical protein n=1 Tax=Paraburkholderia sp. A2WS-5 TaxID=3028372 RepID=UPI003B79E447
MYRIDDATAATSLPTPETAGTEGYFTEGNPATGTPATKVRGSWLNMIQEELRALVIYGGLTPSKIVYTQVRDAIIAKFAKLNGDPAQTFSVAPAIQSQHASQLAQLLAASGPLCSLAYTNSTTLTLSPVKSGKVHSPGYGIVTVPGGGLTLTASGLTASTLYYIYLNPNGGSPTLVASTTGHVTDATGVEVQSGNNSLVLVGMAYALSATTWESTARSWTNDPGYSATSGLTSNSSTASTTLANINTGLNVNFLIWNGELAVFSFAATCSVSSANFGIGNAISIDNATPADPIAGQTPATTNSVAISANSSKAGLSEGRHTSNLFGYVGGAVTGTWVGSASTGVTRTSNSVYIAARK